MRDSGIPLIPYVLICGPIGRFDYPGFAEIVATLSRGGGDPIVVANFTLTISHPRSAPRIQGLRQYCS